MQSKGNLCTLLVAVKIDIAIVENNMEVSQKIKNRADPAILILGVYPHQKMMYIHHRRWCISTEVYIKTSHCTPSSVYYLHLSYIGKAGKRLKKNRNKRKKVGSGRRKENTNSSHLSGNQQSGRQVGLGCYLNVHPHTAQPICFPNIH